MMRLPYYLYTYQRAAEQSGTDRPIRQAAPLRVSPLLVIGCLAWVALLALAAFGQW